MTEFLPLPKVLIVNDDASTLLALSSVLTDPTENQKYDVFTVLSGEEALREVLKHDFAVILLDVSMPGMDGFETAEAIRSHPRSASVPVIFITAYYGDELNRLKGYQKGAADYLFAPIIPQVVQAKVAVFVELNQKTLELQRKTAALEDINGDLRIQRMQDLERANKALNSEVAERRLAEERAMELATRDTLTGLFNRRSLLDRLQQAITRAARRKESLALMFLDLDSFKQINDVFGHEVGDGLLLQVAKQLNAAVRESDMVARLGGDEFVILLEGISDASAISKVAKKVISANSEPQMIGNHLVNTSISIGISLYPEDANTAEVLLKNADLAMYHAKQRTPGSVQFFHEKLNAHEREQEQFESALVQALQNGEFELYYQPKIHFDSGRATGLEAFLYWRHPERGLLAPSEFLVPSGLCGRVGEWVINAACAQIQYWRQELADFVLPVAINLDIGELQPTLATTLASALQRYNVPPSALQFELSEALVARHFATVTDVLHQLQMTFDEGLTFTLDNFGAAAFSLAMCSRLPISALKLDPSLLQGNGQDEGASATPSAEGIALISAFLAMATALNWDLVIDGVDNQQQWQVVRDLGCVEYQGNFFSPPLPANDLLQKLQIHRADQSYG